MFVNKEFICAMSLLKSLQFIKATGTLPAYVPSCDQGTPWRQAKNLNLKLRELFSSCPAQHMMASLLRVSLFRSSLDYFPWIQWAYVRRSFRSPKPEGTETSKGHIFKELNVSIKTVSQSSQSFQSFDTLIPWASQFGKIHLPNHHSIHCQSPLLPSLDPSTDFTWSSYKRNQKHELWWIHSPNNGEQRHWERRSR